MFGYCVCTCEYVVEPYMDLASYFFPELPGEGSLEGAWGVAITLLHCVQVVHSLGSGECSLRDVRNFHICSYASVILILLRYVGLATASCIILMSGIGVMSSMVLALWLHVLITVHCRWDNSTVPGLPIQRSYSTHSLTMILTFNSILFWPVKAVGNRITIGIYNMSCTPQ